MGEAPAPTVMAEAVAMLRGLAQDAACDPELEVTVLVDAELPQPVWDAVAGHAVGRIRKVPAGHEIDALVAEAARADWAIVVAPETAGLLASRVEAVRRAGGRPAACGPRFIRIAGDKQATVTALAAAGVPVPAGRVLAAGEPLPAGFHLPAVCKACDGVGGDGLAIIRSREEALAVVPTPRRAEAFVPGMPVGVSCLCGPAGIFPLPPVRQRFTAGPRPTYQGGAVIGRAPWRRRAESLATRSIAAVMHAAGGHGGTSGHGGEAAAGWVGVDMVLGADEDGGGDRVLEVNPRLTTSFVGLAAGRTASLVRLLLDAAAGGTITVPTGGDGAIEFDASGTARCGDG
jgi:predicted ATP-grasp superfamily ATP-dependent carboligase